ncbi:MAG: hypothetical protein U1A78_26180 [Polyangia bacterium]
MLGSRRGSVEKIPLLGGALACALVACGLAGCAAAPPGIYPPWSQAAAAVKVYFADDKPDCEEILPMGNIEAVSRVTESQKAKGMTATLDSGLAWLREETARRNANAVRVLTHRPNEDQSAYLITGEAFLCRGAR